MPFVLSLVFVAWTVASAFVQASHNPLNKVVSPALTAMCGLIVLYGALAGNVPLGQGLTFALALLLLSASDFAFERSDDKPGLFPIAMVLGVVSGFAVGIMFSVTAWGSVPVWVFGVSYVVGAAAALLVYRYLQVDPPLKLPVYIYLVQAVILLAGGLVSLYARSYPFAVWGISVFVSDSLVGIRAFPSDQRPIPWLNSYRILFTIITIYYSAQYAVVSWAI